MCDSVASLYNSLVKVRPVKEFSCSHAKHQFLYSLTRLLIHSFVISQSRGAQEVGRGETSSTEHTLFLNTQTLGSTPKFTVSPNSTSASLSLIQLLHSWILYSGSLELPNSSRRFCAWPLPRRPSTVCLVVSYCFFEFTLDSIYVNYFASYFFLGSQFVLHFLLVSCCRGAPSSNAAWWTWVCLACPSRTTLAYSALCYHNHHFL